MTFMPIGTQKPDFWKGLMGALQRCKSARYHWVSLWFAPCIASHQAPPKIGFLNSDGHIFTANNLSGQPVSLKAYQGKVLLIVNTASQCGFTPQYQGLEALYQQFKDAGLVVLGFPCNQFGQQEPGNAAEVAAFCEKNYGVTFPLFEKINVNGKNTHPLYQYLKQQAPGLLGSKTIKWNFTKFLIKKDGTVFKRYAPITKPNNLVDDIEKLLRQ